MARRDVERLEVVVVRFDLGTLDGLEAHRAEDPRHLADRGGHRMEATDAHRPRWQCEVDAFAQAAVDRGAVQRRAPALQCCLDPRLRFVHRGAVGGFVLRGKGRDLLGGLRQLAVFAPEVAHARRLEGGVVRAGGDLRHRAVRERLQILWSRHAILSIADPSLARNLAKFKGPLSFPCFRTRDEGGPPRYHPISHRHAADGHSWGALSGSARMRFSAHRLRSEFARSVSLRALSRGPRSLCDVYALLLSVAAVMTCWLYRSSCC